MPEIVCVVMSSNSQKTHHQHITHVGLKSGVLVHVSKVVYNIQHQLDEYWVVDPQTSKKIGVEVTMDLHAMAPYIRTIADGIWTNNLLALPHCSIGSGNACDRP